MFSSGQKIFALLFMIAFVVIIGYQFYKDRQQNKALFKGTYWVLIALMATIIGYIVVQKFIL